MRRLQMSVSGAWYTGFTIVLGVVALISTNNALYLIESLLLSGMIFSGVLSERVVSALRVEVRRFPASAGDLGDERGSDLVQVTNERRFPVYCVEILEQVDGKYTTLAYFPRVGPGESKSLRSRQAFRARGRHRWGGFAIATSYPFGFARKLKVVLRPGERLIWPRREKGSAARTGAGQALRLRPSAEQLFEGEVRPFTFEDDSRLIVWTLSQKGGDAMVRSFRSPRSTPDVVLDLRRSAGAEFEQKVAEAARPFHDERENVAAATLTLVGWKEKRRIRGRERALNELALVQAEGERHA
jgi:uncharacterized protein (DUF58 family)